MEPVVTRTRPGDDIAANLHETPVAAVRELIIRHFGVGLAARHPDPDVSGVLLALQGVRVPGFTEPVIERHREKRVRREHIRGVASEFRFHVVSRHVPWIRRRQNFRELLSRCGGRIRILSSRIRGRFGIIIRLREDDVRLRVPLTREVPVVPDFLQFIEIGTGDEAV